FVYVPNAAIRATGGSDSFTYQASQGSFVSLVAAVTIYVVRVEITTPGVAHAANMTIGAHVPVNANNHNGSFVRDEIPDMRDFQFGAFVGGQAFADPDLVQADVTINPNAGLPGFFTITVTQTAGFPEIKLYLDRNKTADVGGVYTLATLPRTFFIEGLEPSTVLRGSVITVQYVFVGLNGIPLPAGKDQLAATVTPFIQWFDITTGNVDWRQRPWGPGGAMQNVGLDAVGVGPGNAFGALFDAQVTRTNLTGGGLAGGGLAFILNVTAELNATRGAANGYTFAVPAGIHPIPNRNIVPIPVWDGAPGGPQAYEIEENAAGQYVAVPQENAPAGLVAPPFPILDMVNRQLPDPAANPPVQPDYNFGAPNHTEVTDANTQRITDVDGPGTLVPYYPNNALVPMELRRTRQHIAMTDIDIEYQFRMYLVWRFTDGTRYTIATRDSSVVFRATGPGAGVPLNAIDPRSGYFSPNPFAISHADPAVARPTFNFTSEIDPIGSDQPRR
ncbi:MAG: hypothetical protein SGI86_20480, partial [Deltaproteobacteria bacterium]|nr:hypothetical protein [Deltaproteobacteria bacterium]